MARSVANKANQAASSTTGLEQLAKVDTKSGGSEWRRMLLDETGNKKRGENGRGKGKH